MGSSVGRRLGPGNAVPKSYSSTTSRRRSSRAPSGSPSKWGITPRRRRRVRPALAAARRRGLGRGSLRRPDRPGRCARLGDDGKPTGATAPRRARRGPARDDARGPGQLKPVAGEDGVHTAGTSSQISDGAAAVLLTTPREGRRSSASSRWPASSTPASSAATRCSCSPARSTPRRPARAQRHDAWTTSTWSRSTRPSPRSSWPGSASSSADMAARQPQRRRHRARPPARRHGRRPHHQGRARARAGRREHGPVTMCCGGGLGTGMVLERV